MLHLNPAVNGLLMPPDCIKSGVFDSNDVALDGLDIGKDSSKIMAEPGPCWIGSNHFTCASRCEERRTLNGSGLRAADTGLTPSLVSAIWLRIACVADAEHRQRFNAQFEA